MTRRLKRAGFGVGMVVLALVCGRVGVALQKTSPVPAPVPDYSGRQAGNSTSPRSPFDDNTMMREMEDKRGKAMNSERQRLMVRDANQLVQAAAELQVKVGQESGAVGREDEAKRAELIEKLAKSVKERMRGNR